MQRTLILLQLSLVASLSAQQGPPPRPDNDRISGTIQEVSVAADHQGATITIQSGSGRIPHQILFTATTAITYQGKSSSLAEVKTGRMLQCIGGNHNGQFVARSCTVQ